MSTGKKRSNILQYLVLVQYSYWYNTPYSQSVSYVTLISPVSDCTSGTILVLVQYSLLTERLLCDSSKSGVCTSTDCTTLYHWYNTGTILLQYSVHVFRKKMYEMVQYEYCRMTICYLHNEMLVTDKKHD